MVLYFWSHASITLYVFFDFESADGAFLWRLDSLQTANMLKRVNNEDGMRVTRALNAEGYIFTMSF